MCLCVSYSKHFERDAACEICLRMGSQQLISHAFADIDLEILTECVVLIRALISVA